MLERQRPSPIDAYVIKRVNTIVPLNMLTKFGLYAKDMGLRMIIPTFNLRPDNRVDVVIIGKGDWNEREYFIRALYGPDKIERFRC